MYRDLAARTSCALIPFLLEGVAGNPELMQRDGLHPNAEGTGGWPRRCFEQSFRG